VLRIDGLTSAGLLNAGNREAELTSETSFSSYLRDALNQVGSLENQARAAAKDLAVGDGSEIHRVTIAYEKASLALSLTIEIRNRIVEAYQEIMRIQM
jgi:flagellar hook-basal body complex protein FliE